MKKFFILILTTFPFFSYSSVTPKMSNFDKRIQSVNFNKKDVTKLSLYDGLVTSIIFSSDENILDVVSGFPQGYEFKQSTNILYIKPRAIINNAEEIEPSNVWNSNLIVTTDKNVYAFDLIIVRKKSSVSYVVYIDYVKEIKNKTNEESIEDIEKTNQEEIKKELNNFKTPLNWDYYMKFNPYVFSITPVFTYDDGKFTYIGFNPSNSFPNVYLNESGKETLLNTHVEYDGNYQVLVIQRLSESFILRNDKQAILIVNKSYKKYLNTQKYNETSSDKVKRIVQ